MDAIKEARARAYYPYDVSLLDKLGSERWLAVQPVILRTSDWRMRLGRFLNPEVISDPRMSVNRILNASEASPARDARMSLDQILTINNNASTSPTLPSSSVTLTPGRTQTTATPQSATTPSQEDPEQLNGSAFDGTKSFSFVRQLTSCRPPGSVVQRSASEAYDRQDFEEQTESQAVQRRPASHVPTNGKVDKVRQDELIEYY